MSDRLELLQVQADVFAPPGRDLLATLPAPPGARALDAGCGPRGWLPLLAGWAQQVVGADVDEEALAAAAAEAAPNVALVRDDVFDSALEPASFDLVHARSLIAPLGRAPELLAALVRLLRPGGVLVCEELDTTTVAFDLPAPAATALLARARAAVARAGGDLDAGRSLERHVRAAGIEPAVRRVRCALPPGHAYLRLLTGFGGAFGVDGGRARSELGERPRAGTSPTLVQVTGMAR